MTPAFNTWKREVWSTIQNSKSGLLSVQWKVKKTGKIKLRKVFTKWFPKVWWNWKFSVQQKRCTPLFKNSEVVQMYTKELHGARQWLPEKRSPGKACWGKGFLFFVLFTSFLHSSLTSSKQQLFSTWMISEQSSEKQLLDEVELTTTTTKESLSGEF